MNLLRPPHVDRRTFASGLGILVLAWILALWLGGLFARKPHPEQPVVPADSLVVGEIWQQKSFDLTLPVQNQNNEAIEVVDILATCNCTTIDPRSFNLAAGATQNVRLRLDLSTPFLSSPVSPRNALDITLVPLLARRPPDAHPGWTLRGTVVRAVSLEPPRLSFPTELVLGHDFSGKGVTICPLAHLVDIDIRSEGRDVKVTKLRDGPEPGRFRLVVTPRRTLPPGVFRTTVTVRPVTERGTLPSVELPVEGIVHEDVQATPASVHLGIRTMGTEADETITLWSWSGKPVEVIGFEAESPDARVELVPKSAGRYTGHFGSIPIAATSFADSWTKKAALQG